MKALPSNIDKYRKGGCMPVSATCVTWDGPNIPCIDLCKGDTIDVVIYELAKILCDITENVLDVSSLEFDCLLERGQCPPDTLLETIQLIIKKICLPPDPEPPTPFPMPIAQLPECLWFRDENNDLITALPLDEYVEYLAQKICDILIKIDSLESVITSINTQLQIIQNIINNGGGGSTTPPVINITTQCLSGTSPGQTLAIEVAFQNMEQALCSYLQILGTLTQWQEMFNTICIDDTTPLPCGDGTYGDIPGWIVNPVTAAQSMTNLWLVVCQLNDCMSSTPALPCVTVPPVSVHIDSTTATAATISWVPPVTTGSQPPLGYLIQVYDIAGTIPPLLSVTVGPSPLTYNIVDPAITVGTEYIVRVSAIYDCGTSGYVQTTGPLKEAPYVGKLYYTNSATTPKAMICTNPIGPTTTAYNEITNAIKIELKDNSGNPLVNTGTDIEVTIRLEYIACSTDPIVETDLVITIPSGQSQGTGLYVASAMIYCPGEGCITVTRNVLCLVSAELAGGGALPITIGLDTSLTSLGSC